MIALLLSCNFLKTFLTGKDLRMVYYIFKAVITDRVYTVDKQ